MNNNTNTIKELAALFDDFEQLRISLLKSQDALIEAFKRNGATTLEGLKDWQDTFSRIVTAQSEIVRAIRNAVLK